ncbi:MAG: GNAT family N-acetyltransferase, partial [Clostridiaceae bacterium]
NFKKEATLTYLFTRKDQLEKGYATELIQAAENALQEAGFDRIALFVSKENKPALNLYLHLGFMEIPLNTTSLDREFFNEIREWELTTVSGPDE